MNSESAPKIAAYRQLKKLRTSLAILQGARLLSKLQQETEATVSHDQTKRVTYLTELYSRIHREMFRDWKEQASVSHRPGNMPDPEKRHRFRKTIGRLVLDDESNSDFAIFDNSGFVITTDNIAERLADFYWKMRTVRPFGYGNRITLDFFMTMLGKLPAFRGVYEQGIDFRRLDGKDTLVLHDPASTFREITTAFVHALDPSRLHGLNNIPNSYGKWPENKTFISGIPFLSYTTVEGIKCLVAVNGGLVPMALIKEDLFMAGKHLADYPLCVPENLLGYLPDTECLRRDDKCEIDGIEIAENGAAPLFCLDINMLTGLRSLSHTELMVLLRQCAGEKASIFDLVDNRHLKAQLLDEARDDPRLQRSVEIAYQRLLKVADILERAKQVVFAGKTPVAKPQLLMSMGGAGAGKTAVEEIAEALCGDNFVIASLDEFRKQSDLYRVLIAANHHSDDYVYVEPFANRLRDMVAEHARQNGINILYDGTAIPYSPRYSGIVQQFKQAGFYTQIVAVDAFVVKPQGRESELIRTSVLDSVKNRYQQTGRALPWVITIYKHMRAPEAFLEALQDSALDKISLFANDAERDMHYLVAESFICQDQDLGCLQHQQRQTLASYWQGLSFNHPEASLRKLAKNSDEQLAALMARNPHFEESNVAYLVYPGGQIDRILAVYNTQRLVDFIDKRQLNPHASGEQGLLYKSQALAFHVVPYAEQPWIVRLQGSV